MEDHRGQFLALAGQVPQEDVYVEPLDETYQVHGLTARARDQFEQEVSEKGMDNFRARLIVRSLFKDGERVFDDRDMAKLGELPATVLAPLFDVAARLNGLTLDDVEELEKNSESVPTDS
jgi:hypothetical protein